MFVPVARIPEHGSRMSKWSLLFRVNEKDREWLQAFVVVEPASEDIIQEAINNTQSLAWRTISSLVDETMHHNKSPLKLRDPDSQNL